MDDLPIGTLQQMSKALVAVLLTIIFEFYSSLLLLEPNNPPKK